MPQENFPKFYWRKILTLEDSVSHCLQARCYFVLVDKNLRHTARYQLEYHNIKLNNFNSHLRLTWTSRENGYDSMIAGVFTTGQTVSAAVRTISVVSQLALSNLQGHVYCHCEHETISLEHGDPRRFLAVLRRAFQNITRLVYMLSECGDGGAATGVAGAVVAIGLPIIYSATSWGACRNIDYIM